MCTQSQLCQFLVPTGGWMRALLGGALHPRPGAHKLFSRGRSLPSFRKTGDSVQDRSGNTSVAPTPIPGAGRAEDAGP